MKNILAEVLYGLIDKNLLVNYSWTGQSRSNKIALDQFKNVHKLIHSIIIVFIPDFCLDEIGLGCKKTFLRYAKTQLKNQGKRKRSVHKCHTRNKRGKSNEFEDDETDNEGYKNNESQKSDKSNHPGWIVERL